MTTPTDGAGRAATILVVDDDDAVRDALGGELEDHGYDVIRARDGDHALRLMDERVPDLAVVDLLMPGLDGWGLIDAMRARGGRVASTRIVVMSAGGASVLARAPVVAGYVAKPIRMTTLLGLVERLLSLAGVNGDVRPS
jgi:two-component system response regulator MprA